MEEKKKIINIHLIEIAKMLKADSKMIRNYSLIAGLIGVILAFATPKAINRPSSSHQRSRAAAFQAASRRWRRWWA